MADVVKPCCQVGANPVTCSQFRADYQRWWDQGPVHNQYPTEQQAWSAHQQDCAACRDWGRRQYCSHRGIDPDRHCCLDMASAIAHPILTWPSGENRILDWVAAWDEYRIPMTFDGYTSTLIRQCPWCGAQLGASKRDLWYQTLRALGYDDPGNEAVPDEFASDRWWRTREAGGSASPPA